MDYGFWWDIATYGSENWKGFFSPREIAENAYEYKQEWDYSVQTGELSGVIAGLLRNIKEDIGNILVDPKADAQLGVMLSDWWETIEKEIEYHKLKEA